MRVEVANVFFVDVNVRFRFLWRWLASVLIYYLFSVCLFFVFLLSFFYERARVV